MLSLRYPFEYLGAKGLEYYRKCEPVTHEKKKDEDERHIFGSY